LRHLKIPSRIFHQSLKDGANCRFTVGHFGARNDVGLDAANRMQFDPATLRSETAFVTVEIPLAYWNTEARGVYGEAIFNHSQGRAASPDELLDNEFKGLQLHVIENRIKVRNSLNPAFSL